MCWLEQVAEATPTQGQDKTVLSKPNLRRGAEKEEKEQHDTGELCTSVLLLLLKTNIGVLFASFYSIVPSAQVFFNIAYETD